MLSSSPQNFQPHLPKHYGEKPLFSPSLRPHRLAAGRAACDNLLFYLCGYLKARLGVCSPTGAGVWAGSRVQAGHLHVQCRSRYDVLSAYHPCLHTPCPHPPRNTLQSTSASDPAALEELLVKVRSQLFARGVTSTGTIIRACSRADWNSSKSLDAKEFDECMRRCARGLL